MIGSHLSAKAFASVSAIALLQGFSSSVRAQEPADSEDPQVAEGTVVADEPGTIIVVGRRSIIASLADVPTEQTYEESDLTAYAANTVGDVLDSIQEENGDEEPSLLVNGRPTPQRGDIADLPAEAISRIEVLPRGTAQRVNGATGQRVYNIVLKNSFRSLALTGSRETATEGGWSAFKEEVQLTSIKGQNRLNLTFRAGQSGTLLESERDFVPRVESVPFSPIGNILPAFSTEVDPALSLLLGEPVTVVAIPQDNLSPNLLDLLSGANIVHPSDQSLYRSLRGKSRNQEIALSGNEAFSDRISLSFNARLGWSSSSNLSGLPSGRFLLPPSNIYSPFGVPVYIALNDPARPLRSGFDNNTQALSATLSAAIGRWQTRLITRYDRRSQDFAYQFTGPFFGVDATIDDAANPFAGVLAARIPVTSREATSTTSTMRVDLEAEGSLLDLWAGPLDVRFGIGAGWVDFSAKSDIGNRGLNRSETGFDAGLTLPLSSKEGSLSWLGDTDLSLDYGWTALGDFEGIERRVISLNWAPVPWTRISASTSREGRPLSLELQSAPSTISPNLPYFDPITGKSVEVTAIYGGAGDIINEQLRSRSVGATILPLSKHKLQIDLEYTVDDLRNQIGPLPSPTTSVVLAFPDRFQRDEDGTLVLVDNRSINFFRQRSERLRLGTRVTLPISGSGTAGPTNTSRGREPPVNLQFNASHIILLSNELTIREGLPPIDMLEGGAIGIGGGQPASITNAGVALTKASSGIRLDIRRRGRSTLLYGSLVSPQRLDFAPLTTIDAKLFVDLGQHLPDLKAIKDTRLSVSVDNIFNRRQRVVDQTGATPQAFQPIRRDPIGRTFSIELRKVF